MIKSKIQVEFGEGDIGMRACSVEEQPEAIVILLKNGAPGPVGFQDEEKPRIDWEPDESDMAWVFKDANSLRNVADFLKLVANRKEQEE